MNPLNLVGRGVRLATLPVRVASNAPKVAWQLLHRDEDKGDPFAAATAVEEEEQRRETERPASGRAPGGTGRRAPSPAATPGRATTSDGVVETTAAPAEPTSAAGASGGVAGTAAAPQAAAIVDAPDPTAPHLPQGERKARDVRPVQPRRKTVDTEETLVETEGAATPGATLRVDAPWDGYDQMKAQEIVARVRGGDDAAKAVVRLYEQTHKKRKSILDATAS
jgi:hypothetical protein